MSFIKWLKMPFSLVRRFYQYIIPELAISAKPTYFLAFSGFVFSQIVSFSFSFIGAFLFFAGGDGNQASREVFFRTLPIPYYQMAQSDLDNLKQLLPDAYLAPLDQLSATRQRFDSSEALRKELLLKLSRYFRNVAASDLMNPISYENLFSSDNNEEGASLVTLDNVVIEQDRQFFRQRCSLLGAGTWCWQNHTIEDALQPYFDSNGGQNATIPRGTVLSNISLRDQTWLTELLIWQSQREGDWVSFLLIVSIAFLIAFAAMGLISSALLFFQGQDLPSLIRTMVIAGSLLVGMLFSVSSGFIFTWIANNESRYLESKKAQTRNEADTHFNEIKKKFLTIKAEDSKKNTNWDQAQQFIWSEKPTPTEEWENTFQKLSRNLDLFNTVDLELTSLDNNQRKGSAFRRYLDQWETATDGIDRNELITLIQSVGNRLNAVRLEVDGLRGAPAGFGNKSQTLFNSLGETLKNSMPTLCNYLYQEVSNHFQKVGQLPPPIDNPDTLRDDDEPQLAAYIDSFLRSKTAFSELSCAEDPEKGTTVSTIIPTLISLRESAIEKGYLNFHDKLEQRKAENPQINTEEGEKVFDEFEKIFARETSSEGKFKVVQDLNIRLKKLYPFFNYPDPKPIISQNIHQLARLQLFSLAPWVDVYHVPNSMREYFARGLDGRLETALSTMIDEIYFSKDALLRDLAERSGKVLSYNDQRIVLGVLRQSPEGLRIDKQDLALFTFSSSGQLESGGIHEVFFDTPETVIAALSELNGNLIPPEDQIRLKGLIEKKDLDFNKDYYPFIFAMLADTFSIIFSLMIRFMRRKYSPGIFLKIFRSVEIPFIWLVHFSLWGENKLRILREASDVQKEKDKEFEKMKQYFWAITQRSLENLKDKAVTGNVTDQLKPLVEKDFGTLKELKKATTEILKSRFSADELNRIVTEVMKQAVQRNALSKHVTEALEREVLLSSYTDLRRVEIKARNLEKVSDSINTVLKNDEELQKYLSSQMKLFTDSRFRINAHLRAMEQVEKKIETQINATENLRMETMMRDLELEYGELQEQNDSLKSISKQQTEEFGTKFKAFLRLAKDERLANMLSHYANESPISWKEAQEKFREKLDEVEREFNSMLHDSEKTEGFLPSSEEPKKELEDYSKTPVVELELAEIEEPTVIAPPESSTEANAKEETKEAVPDKSITNDRHHTQFGPRQNRYEPRQYRYKPRQRPYESRRPRRDS